MNPELCKKCNKLHFFVIDKTMSFDEKPYFVYEFSCEKENRHSWFRAFRSKIIEEYKLIKGRWHKLPEDSFIRKLIKRIWFKFFKKRFIDNQLKQTKLFVENCPYKIEHEIYELNNER